MSRGLGDVYKRQDRDREFVVAVDVHGGGQTVRPRFKFRLAESRKIMPEVLPAAPPTLVVTETASTSSSDSPKVGHFVSGLVSCATRWTVCVCVWVGGWVGG